MTDIEFLELSAEDLGDVQVVCLAGGCSLAKTGAKDSWVEKTGAGELPEYICEVARGIKRSGKSTSTAIAMAISQIKRWAAGGENVDAKTRAKAAAALAAWEKLKASSKAKLSAESSGTVSLSADETPYGDVEYADPGYQEGGVKRYPLDSEAHCRSAWSYINMPKNAAEYTPEQLAKIKTAAKKHGVEISE